VGKKEGGREGGRQGGREAGREGGRSEMCRKLHFRASTKAQKQQPRLQARWCFALVESSLTISHTLC
jgi:hypothetical protein